MTQDSILFYSQHMLLSNPLSLFSRELNA